MVQNSEHFSPLRNGSKRNSESFLFRGTAGIPPEQSNCSVYSVFHGIIFLSEIANPSDCCRLQYNQPVWWECRNAGYSADSSGGQLLTRIVAKGELSILTPQLLFWPLVLLEMDSVTPLCNFWSMWLLYGSSHPRHSKVYGRVNSEARNVRN